MKRRALTVARWFGDRWSTIWPWLPVVWFVALLVVGFGLLSSYTGSWTEGLYFSITQFFGAFPTPPEDGAQISWGLQIVRTLTALTGLGTLLFAAYLLAYREWGWTRARRAEGHTVVIGTGDAPLRLATQLGRSRERRRTWLVDTDPETPPPRPFDSPKRLRLESLQHLDDLLGNAAEVYILERDASQALRLLTAAVYAAGADEASPRKVFLVTDDSDLASEFLGWEPGEDSRTAGAVTVDVIDALARLLDRSVMPSEPVRSTQPVVDKARPPVEAPRAVPVREILIVGEGHRALAAAQFAADGFSVVDSIPIQVIGVDADEIVRSLQSQRPDIRARAHRIADDLTGLVPTVQQLLEAPTPHRGVAGTMVVVTGHSDDTSVVRTSAIARSLRRSSVLLRCVIDGPSPNKDSGQPLIGTEQAEVFSIEDSVADPAFYRETTGDSITSQLRAEILRLHYPEEAGQRAAMLRTSDELVQRLPDVVRERGWRPPEVDLGDVRRAIGKLGYQFAAGQPPAVLSPQELVILEREMLQAPPDSIHPHKRFERLRWLNALPVALARTGVGLVRVKPTRPWMPKLDGHTIERMGRAIHETYCRHMTSSGQHHLVEAWEELSYPKQIANFSQAHNYSVMLAFLGLALMPAPVDPSRLRSRAGEDVRLRVRELCDLERRNRAMCGGALFDGELSDWNDVVAFLAEREHDRWCLTLLSAGWSYGNQKDAEAQTHPDLVEWRTLMDDERGIDVEFILALDEVVAAAGMLMVPQSVVDVFADSRPVSPRPVKLARPPADGTFDGPSGQPLFALPGSVWVRDAEVESDRRWPVHRDVFRSQFTRTGSGSETVYQRSTVYEVEVEVADLLVPTLEGVSLVHEGDHLRVGVTGDIWAPTRTRPGESRHARADEQDGR